MTHSVRGPEISFDSQREQVFDQMAAKWDEIMPPIPREKYRELIALADIQDKTVLDVGAGTGVLVEAGLAAAPQRPDKRAKPRRFYVGVKHSWFFNNPDILLKHKPRRFFSRRRIIRGFFEGAKIRFKPDKRGVFCAEKTGEAGDLSQ